MFFVVQPFSCVFITIDRIHSSSDTLFLCLFIPFSPQWRRFSFLLHDRHIYIIKRTHVWARQCRNNAKFSPNYMFFIFQVNDLLSLTTGVVWLICFEGELLFVRPKPSALLRKMIL